MGGWLRRYRWFVAAGLVLVAVVTVVFLAWPTGRRLPPARAREYTQFSACLLTDSGGVSGSTAAPVWAGMEKASLVTSGKVSYLAVSGADTTANAVFYVNTLAQRKCDLIIAAGATEVDAVRQQASAFPAKRFVVVGPGSGGAVPSGTNVSTVDRSSHTSDTAVSSAVQALVTEAARKISVR